MKRFRLRNSSGDTIVEVLVVLTILSLAFAISYATANHGLIQSRNAEEHSEALGILNSQVELLRSAVSQETNVFIATPFCMTGPTTLNNSFPVGYTIPADPATDVLTNYPAACIQNTLYHVSISYDSGQDVFSFRVRWDGLGDLGRQQEEIDYKIDALSLIGGAFGNNPVLGGGGGGGGGGGAFDWLAGGSSYGSCSAGEALWNDGLDGCFTTGGSMYAWRDVNAVYNFSSGITTGSIVAGNANLVINYNQLSTGGAVPPSGYGSFNVIVKISSGSTTTATAVNLPITSDANSYNSISSSPTTVSVPAGPVTIELDWTNNTGIDPNLEINSIHLYSP